MGKKTKVRYGDPLPIVGTLADYPVGAAVRINAVSFWYLITAKIGSGSDAPRMLRRLDNGRPDTSEEWIYGVDNRAVLLAHSNHRVTDACWPYRHAVKSDVVKDPVAGVADLGPLFAGKSKCPECELESHWTIVHKGTCSRGRVG